MEQDLVTRAIGHDCGAILREVDVRHSAVVALYPFDRREVLS